MFQLPSGIVLLNKPQHSQVLDADEVYSGIYVGSAPPKGSAVAKAGFNAVVLCAAGLESKYDANDFGSSVAVFRCPLDDSPEPMPSRDIRNAVDTAFKVARVSARGGKVLVTCQAGVNRSALVAALAIYARTNMTPESVIQLVRKSRCAPVGMKALSNLTFQKMVHEADEVFRLGGYVKRAPAP